MDANAPKGYLPEGTARLSAITVPASNSSGVVGSSGASTILGKANKIDPYYLITQVCSFPLLLGSLLPAILIFLVTGSPRTLARRSEHIYTPLESVFVRRNGLAVGHATPPPPIRTGSGCSSRG